MIFRFIAAIIFATWLIWQIPFSSTDEIRLPEISAFASYADATPAAAESPALVFFRKGEVGQYTAYGVNAAGAMVRQQRLPGGEITKADDTKISLSGKEGYLTAPENGAYYIWYPQIGTQVYVFNEQGNFLWEKEESHYLNALPRGRFIMAAAGDHSRLVFMNPDFKVHADFQGVLFTRFIVDDNPDLKTAQVCLASLDGELIIAHLDRKLYARHKLGYALKALQCDFETGEFAAIVERSVDVEKRPTQRDFLMRAKFNLGTPKEDKPSETMRMVAGEIDVILTSELPVLTQTASPLVLGGDSACFMQTAPEGEGGTDRLALYFTPGKKSALKHIVLTVPRATENAVAADLSADLWRGAGIRLKNESACLFAHRSGRFIIANRRGILLDRNDLAVERMIVRGEVAYFQTDKGILTFK